MYMKTGATQPFPQQDRATPKFDFTKQARKALYLRGDERQPRRVELLFRICISASSSYVVSMPSERPILFI